MTYPLAADFPTTTTAETAATIEKLDGLVRDGFFNDIQAAVVLGWIGTYIDTIAETYALASAAYTGAGGAVTRNYCCVPVYPLPESTPGFSLVQLPNAPPQGWPPFLTNGFVQNNPATAAGRQNRYGIIQATTAVASTATTLDASHYVTVTLPAASADFPNVTFDVLVQDGSGLYNLIASGVAAGGTVVDNGLVRQPYSMLPNTGGRYQHSEVGVDTGGSSHVILYGSLVFIEGDTEG